LPQKARKLESHDSDHVLRSQQGTARKFPTLPIGVDNSMDIPIRDCWKLQYWDIADLKSPRTMAKQGRDTVFTPLLFASGIFVTVPLRLDDGITYL